MRESIIPATKTGCVIEVKYAEDGKFEQTLANAMEQIDKNGYAEVLKQDGMETIYKYGIAC